MPVGAQLGLRGPRGGVVPPTAGGEGNLQGASPHAVSRLQSWARAAPAALASHCIKVGDNPSIPIRDADRPPLWCSPRRCAAGAARSQGGACRRRRVAKEILSWQTAVRKKPAPRSSPLSHREPSLPQPTHETTHDPLSLSRSRPAAQPCAHLAGKSRRPTNPQPSGVGPMQAKKSRSLLATKPPAPRRMQTANGL